MKVCAKIPMTLQTRAIGLEGAKVRLRPGDPIEMTAASLEKARAMYGADAFEVVAEDKPSGKGAAGGKK